MPADQDINTVLCHKNKLKNVVYISKPDLYELLQMLQVKPVL